MNRLPRILLPAVLLLIAGTLSAQIGLRLEAENTRYICFEPVTVKLTVANLSGNTLVFGGNDPAQQGRIYFSVEGGNGKQVRQIAKITNPAADLKLGPGERREIKVVVNKYYNMQRDDFYTIRALLDHKRLPRTHISDPVRIEVHDGVPLLTKSIGLPTRNATSVIKTIQLTLLRFTDTDEDIYSLRAEDESTVYAVFRLGSFIDGAAPQMELDDSSLVHILLQIRPRLYAYFIFGFEGRNMRLLQKRFYVSADGAPPTLSRATGYLRIIHGRYARPGVDYVEVPKDAPKPPKLPATPESKRIH